MNRITKSLLAVGVLAALPLAFWQLGAGHAGDDQAAAQPGREAPPPTEGRADLPLREYMRLKLAASNKVLEGLCVDDARLVRDGARELNAMSGSERWRISSDVMYRQFSSEFRRITGQLVESAEKENLDRAALQWMEATMSCIECHRFVRGMMITDAAKPESAP